MVKLLNIIMWTKFCTYEQNLRFCTWLTAHNLELQAREEIEMAKLEYDPFRASDETLEALLIQYFQLMYRSQQKSNS
jgi:hypothetical protein